MNILRIFVALAWTAIFSTVILVGLLFDPNIRWFFRGIRFWAGWLLRIFGIRVRVSGVEHLREGQAYVYAANHASMFDILAVQTGIPDNVHIMFKKELGRVPLWGWALARSPYIKIDRYNPREASASLDTAATAIRAGKSVLVYPEGTRTRTGLLQPFKRGTFTLAVRAGVPVVPVSINNTFSILRKGSLHIHPADIDLVIGPPILVDGGGKEVELRLMEDVRKAIAKNYVNQSTAN